jgi:hypothetical protein
MKVLLLKNKKNQWGRTGPNKSKVKSLKKRSKPKLKKMQIKTKMV